MSLKRLLSDYQSFLYIHDDLCFDLQLLPLFKEPVLGNCIIQLCQPEAIDPRTLLFLKLDFNSYMKTSPGKLNFQYCDFTVGRLAVFQDLTFQVRDTVFKYTEVQIRTYRDNFGICVLEADHVPVLRALGQYCTFFRLHAVPLCSVIPTPTWSNSLTYIPGCFDTGIQCRYICLVQQLNVFIY